MLVVTRICLSLLTHLNFSFSFNFFFSFACSNLTLSFFSFLFPNLTWLFLSLSIFFSWLSESCWWWILFLSHLSILWWRSCGGGSMVFYRLRVIWVYWIWIWPTWGIRSLIFAWGVDGNFVVELEPWLVLLGFLEFLCRGEKCFFFL